MYRIRDGKKFIGWFICKNIREGYFNESVTNEFAYTNEKALKAMMGFLATLPTNVRKITLVAPYALDLWPYFKEPFIDTVLKPEMQFRVVDLVQAIKKRGYRNTATGKISITILDADATWNTGTWQMVIDKGKVSKVAKTKSKPDAECDIQTFSQLFCGYSSAERLAWEGKLTVGNNKTIERLNQLFHDFPTHMQDWF
jgi:predicted acetyltransferase